MTGTLAKARAHHRRHGDMDGGTCLLARCAEHYPAMDVATAKRCVAVCAKYFRQYDDSPRAARDLEKAVEVLTAQAYERGRKSVKK